MILTKDNLLKYVRENKYVTPTTVAETFETTTMIASAALSEIAKEKLISITYLKLSSSPYYYDNRQPQALMELADKHLTSYDKEAYTKLKEEQVINDASLTIQVRLAMDRIKDFANSIEIDYNDNKLKFWVWYLRDIKETKKQIEDYLKGENDSQKQTQQKSQTQNKKENKNTPEDKILEENVQKEVSKKEEDTPKHDSNPKKFEPKEETDDIETFIENYFRENYLRIESKNKLEKKITYHLAIRLNKMTIYFDSVYYEKKPTEAEILRFYGSSQKPKIVFIKNAPKKFFKLAENLENIFIVNI